MAALNFTWFQSYTEALLALESEGLQLEFALAVARYGTYGTEPEFESNILKAVFAGVRPNIENSRRDSKNGKKGAEKRKANAEAERRKSLGSEYSQGNDGGGFAVPEFVKQRQI